MDLKILVVSSIISSFFGDSLPENRKKLIFQRQWTTLATTTRLYNKIKANDAITLQHNDIIGEYMHGCLWKILNFFKSLISYSKISSIV